MLKNRMQHPDATNTIPNTASLVEAVRWSNLVIDSTKKGMSRLLRHPLFSFIQLIAYFKPSNSTSKIKVAFGGITPPAPLAP